MEVCPKIYQPNHLCKLLKQIIWAHIPNAQFSIWKSYWSLKWRNISKNLSHPTQDSESSVVYLANSHQLHSECKHKTGKKRQKNVYIYNPVLAKIVCYLIIQAAGYGIYSSGKRFTIELEKMPIHLSLYHEFVCLSSHPLED